MFLRVENTLTQFDVIVQNNWRDSGIEARSQLFQNIL